MHNSKAYSIEIIPAILAEDENTFVELGKKALSFAPRVQFDFMDGVFVPSLSVPVDFLRVALGLMGTHNSVIEVHLMVYNPEQHAHSLKEAGASTVVFHYEAVENPAKTAELFKDVGFEVGIAFNPETPETVAEELISFVDFIMFMTVKPGYYGSPLELSALEKVRRFSEKHPEFLIEVDGGVKLENLELFIKAGARRICVGSAIMKSEDPLATYEKFVKSAKEKVG